MSKAEHAGWKSLLLRIFGVHPGGLSQRYMFFGRREWMLVGAFFLLILIPGALLGFLSWRAIENEKLVARQRLELSYRQVLELATREVNRELAQIEARWRKEILRFYRRIAEHPQPDLFQKFIARRDLIEACYYLVVPGKLVFPADVRLDFRFSQEPFWTLQSHRAEYQRFEELKERGEELEYNLGNLSAAIETYRTLFREMHSPQLKATALSYLGRAFLKGGQLDSAYATFARILQQYPEVRDLNNMYLRFLAQLQMASIREIQGNDPEAIQLLVTLARDLYNRSDAISPEQYEYFVKRIKILSVRLLTSQKIPDRDRFRSQLEELTRKGKKRISQRYFVELLAKKLYEATVEGKRYRPKIRYITGESHDDYYLLGYQFTPGTHHQQIGGIFGFKVHMRALNQLLLSSLENKLNLGENPRIIIQGNDDEVVLGRLGPRDQVLASMVLEKPFDFWKVSVVAVDGLLPSSQGFHTVLGLWLVSLLVMSIFAGTYIFIRRALREAYLARLKTDFISRISHELRTPLASMKMMAELLEMDLAEGAHPQSTSTQEYAQVIRRECDRLNRLIENMLTWLRQDQGRRRYRFENEDPLLVFHNALQVFRPLAHAEGFHLKVQLPSQLPEVWMDADAIMQVIINLLHNALKFSDGKKRIEFRAGHSENHIWFQVQDYGIGIHPAQLDRIFEPYFQTDARLNARKQGGMGLGLTLVQQIVQDHSGTVEVKSEPGKGTVVTVRLPISPNTVREKQSLSEPEQAGSVDVRSMPVKP